MRWAATDAWAVQSILGTLLARTLPACCHKGVPEVAMNKLGNWRMICIGEDNK